jgi:hypothetical protein
VKKEIGNRSSVRFVSSNSTTGVPSRAVDARVLDRAGTCYLPVSSISYVFADTTGGVECAASLTNTIAPHFGAHGLRLPGQAANAFVQGSALVRLEVTERESSGSSPGR